MVILKSVALSGNPEAEVVSSKEGINGKLNRASDGALYCVLTIVDNSNPLKQNKAVRTYRQNSDGKGGFRWPGITPAEFLQLQGQPFPGKFVRANVAPYQIGENTVSTYTTYVGVHENVVSVFEAQGHPIVGEEVFETQGAAVMA